MSPGLNHYKAIPARSPKQLKKKATDPKVHGLSITINVSAFVGPPGELHFPSRFRLGRRPSLPSIYFWHTYSTETPFSFWIDFFVLPGIHAPPLTSCRFFLLFLCDSYSSRVFRFGSLFSRPGGENQRGSGEFAGFFFFFSFFHPRKTVHPPLLDWTCGLLPVRIGSLAFHLRCRSAPKTGRHYTHTHERASPGPRHDFQGRHSDPTSYGIRVVVRKKSLFYGGHCYFIVLRSLFFFLSLLPALSFHKARLFSAICARGRGTDGENKKGGKRHKDSIEVNRD